MDFSWTDRFRATIGSCVPCLLTPPDAGDSDDERHHQQYYGSAYHRDELEGLLIDSQTDNEADAMSLHSNPGVPLRGSGGSGGGGKKKGKAWRKKRKNAAARKGVKLFGYDLFGRPMPDDFDDSDEGDDDLARPPRRRHFGMSSSSTLDSDAAPLSDSAIADLSKWEPPLTDADLAREEEEQRLLEEKMMRKERKKERKELKRVAAAMAAGIIRDDADEFEGFQGSGTGLPPRVPTFGKPRRGTIDDEEFGPFAGANSAQSLALPPSARAATAAFAADAAADVFAEDEDEGDFGGEYNRKSKSGNNSGSGSGSRSHSRSRSGTSSQQQRGGGQVATYRMGGSNPYNVPLPSSASGSTPRRTEFLDSPTPKRPKKTSSKKDKDTTKSESSNRSKSSANSSSSIRSPPPQRPSNDLGVRVVMEQEFEGFPGGGLDAADVAAAAAAASASAATADGGILSPTDGTANGFRFPAPGHPEAHIHDTDDGTAGGFRFPAPSPASSFPSTGFGRKAGGGAAGVALANRGDS